MSEIHYIAQYALAEPAGVAYREGMARVDAIRLLREARRQGVALAAVNAVNLETAAAVVEAAEAEGAPVIVQVSHNAARYAGFAPLAAAARALREAARTPVVLHFDHAEDVDTALRALNEDFDSVMLETAGLDPREQDDALARVAQRASELGAGFEAEAEITPKGERGSVGRRTPAELAAFVQRSGCTSLAVDIGTRHKQRERRARLDHERLRMISAAVEVPLVLHGSSGVSDDDLRRAAAEGMSKVNLATALMMAFTGGVRQGLEDPRTVDARIYLAAGRDAMRARVREYLWLLGSARLRMPLGS